MHITLNLTLLNCFLLFILLILVITLLIGLYDWLTEPDAAEELITYTPQAIVRESTPVRLHLPPDDLPASPDYPPHP